MIQVGARATSLRKNPKGTYGKFRCSILSDIRGQPLQKFAAHVERRLNIFFQHRFIGMMADAAGAAQEEHGRGYARSHDHGVVAGAAGHALHGQAG